MTRFRLITAISAVVLTGPSSASSFEAFTLSLVDENGRVRYQSTGLANRLGYTAERVAESDWFTFLHSEDAEPVRAQFGVLISSGASTGRWIVRFETALGDALPVEVRAHNLMADPEVGAVLLSMREVPA